MFNPALEIFGREKDDERLERLRKSSKGEGPMGYRKTVFSPIG